MARANVLVVEDDESIRRLLIELLAEHALTVDGARDGAEALHLVATRGYDLIVLDLMMPYMTGIDFLDSLQALVSDPSVKTLEQTPPVVIITAAPEEQIPSAVIEQRFHTIVRHIFRKPLDVDELARCVENLLPRRK